MCPNTYSFSAAYNRCSSFSNMDVDSLSVNISELKKTKSEFALAQRNLLRSARRNRQTPFERMGLDVFSFAVCCAFHANKIELGQLYVRTHLAIPRGSRVWDEDGDDDSGGYDESLCAQMLVDALVNPVFVVNFHDVNSSIHFRAARFYAEWGVFQWLLQVNTRGVSPPRGAVVNEFIDQFPDSSRSGEQATAFLQRLLDRKVSKKKWIRSFRKRWRAVYMKMPTGTLLSNEQIGETVLATWGILWVVIENVQFEIGIC